MDNCKLYISILLIIFNIDISIGQKNREEALCAYVYNLAKLTSSAKQDSLNTYNILLISDQEDIIEEFKKIESKHKIHKKEIRITVSNGNNIDYSNICLVFISANKNDLYLSVFEETIEKEVLIISENYNDKRKILINLYDTDDGRILFEVNKGNIYKRQIHIKDGILLLGGTEIDLVKLYLKSQKELESVQVDITKLQKSLTETKMRVDIQKVEIKKQKELIANQKKEQQELLLANSNYKKEIHKQQKRYNKNEFELKKSFDSLRHTKLLINEQNEKIISGNNILKLQNAEIEQKNALIQLKENVLNKQYRKIRTQRIIVASFIIVFILIILLVILLLKSFSDKNRKNKLLEKQKKEIGEMNAKLKAQKEYLEITNKNLNESNYLLEERQQFINKQTELLKKKNYEMNKLNATKDKFFSIIAHDLKSPFFSVLGSLELIIELFDELQNKKKKEMIKIAYLSSKNIYKLLENLLQWSISQTGQMKFIPEPININKIVSENFGICKELATQKNTMLINDIDENLVITADQNILNTVIINILTNAIKFTENGTISITSQINANNLFLNISDTGIGISEEKIKNLFSLEKNKSTPGTNGESGTGLGLILCKDLIEKHKGTIKVNSTIGKGTTFSIIIPINTEASGS